MRKIMIGLFLLMIACSGNMGDDDLSRYKGIAWAEIPGSCLAHRDDVCALFDCMVDLCWCDDSSPELPIIYEKNGVAIQGEEEAAAYVTESLGIQVKRAVELNDIFYNVFAEDESGDEVVYTLAVDGTIIKTMCGV